jgi:hypothetical protein
MPSATSRPGRAESIRNRVRAVGRKVDVDDLVSRAEIAARLGLSSSEAVRSWRKRYGDFPEPVVKLAGIHIYAWPDIERWAAAADRPRAARWRAT